MSTVTVSDVLTRISISEESWQSTLQRVYKGGCWGTRDLQKPTFRLVHDVFHVRSSDVLGPFLANHVVRHITRVNLNSNNHLYAVVAFVFPSLLCAITMDPDVMSQDAINAIGMSNLHDFLRCAEEFCSIADVNKLGDDLDPAWDQGIPIPSNRRIRFPARARR